MKVHGRSFGTFLAYAGYPAYTGASLLLVEDDQGAVFGGYAPVAWEKHSDFFGDHSSFLFRWAGARYVIIYCGGACYVNMAWEKHSDFFGDHSSFFSRWETGGRVTLRRICCRCLFPDLLTALSLGAARPSSPVGRGAGRVTLLCVVAGACYVTM